MTHYTIIELTCRKVPCCCFNLLIFLLGVFASSLCFRSAPYMHTYAHGIPNLYVYVYTSLVLRPFEEEKGLGTYLYYIQRNIFFRRSFFFYSSCLNLVGIKDELFYKFRRPTNGQNCSAVCTNKGCSLRSNSYI